MEADDRLQEVDFCFFNVLLNILFCCSSVDAAAQSSCRRLRVMSKISFLCAVCTFMRWHNMYACVELQSFV